MTSSSPIETKANRLNKMLPENEYDQVILEYDALEKKPTNYMYSENCIEAIVNDYEALVFYIINGVKPSWLAKEIHFEPESILLSLYANYANLFIEFIQSVKDDINSLTRTIKLIDRNTFNTNYSFHSEINNHLAFIEINKELLLQSSLINSEQ